MSPHELDEAPQIPYRYIMQYYSNNILGILISLSRLWFKELSQVTLNEC